MYSGKGKLTRDGNNVSAAEVTKWGDNTVEVEWDLATKRGQKEPHGKNRKEEIISEKRSPYVKCQPLGEERSKMDSKRSVKWGEYKRGRKKS